MFGSRKNRDVNQERTVGGSDQKQRLKCLGYALPRSQRDDQARIERYDDLELYNVPLGDPHSFTEFDGVVLFGGAFERIQSDVIDRQFAVCAAEADLDLREREFYTLVQKEKIIIFLVPNLARVLDFNVVDFRVDLFRRVMQGQGIYWDVLRSPVAHVHSDVPEFQEFIERYGTVYLHYSLRGDLAKRICGEGGEAFAFTLADKIFVLPCAYPQRHTLAIEMAVTAIRAARKYRERVKEAFPEWVSQFRFEKESELIAEVDELRGRLLTLEAEFDVYKQYKGALCFRSDPLVRVVTEVLHSLLGISLQIEDKCVEDASLVDGEGKIAAVFEIKGVNGNFTRQNVNQVDSHRERLSLPSTTPGVLIMNTIMSAASLAEKDQPPHPDIIKKAVADNVLLIRTLDLLKCADLCQTGRVSKEQFRTILLSRVGWLSPKEGGIVIRQE